MNADLFMVIGIVLAGFSIPSILSALTDRRAPRASAITLLIAGGLFILAFQTRPGGYTSADIPEAFVRVAAQYLP